MHSEAGMSGRSAKEAMEKIRERATRAYEAARGVINRGDPEEAPLGSGLAERARQAIRGGQQRTRDEIERQGG
jgi:hypothetical protein